MINEWGDDFFFNISHCRHFCWFFASFLAKQARRSLMLLTRCLEIAIEREVRSKRASSLLGYFVFNSKKFFCYFEILVKMAFASIAPSLQIF